MPTEFSKYILIVASASAICALYLASSASYTTASSVAPASAWIDATTSNSSGKKFIYFVNDGSAFFVVNNWNQYIEKYSMSTPYDLSSAPAAGSPTQTLDPTSYENDIQGFYFKPDGKSLITIGGQGNGIDQWNMTTAWDLSTASHVGFQFVDTDNFRFFTVRPDGTEFFYNQGSNGTQPRQINRKAINSAWNISAGIGSQQNTLLTDNSNQNWNFAGGKFSADGKQFYVIQTTQFQTAGIARWTMTTGWDYTTFNNSPSRRSFTNLVYELKDIAFADDGKKLFLLSTVGPTAIYRYDYVA